MISVLLIITITKPDLSSVSSPYEVASVAHKINGLQAYRHALAKTREALEQYGQLSKVEKRKVVVNWYESIRTQHNLLAGQWQQRLPQKYIDELYNCDLGKIDLLRMMDGKPGFFNGQSCLRRLYSCERFAKGFKIPSTIDHIPELEFGTGAPPPEEINPSVDPKVRLRTRAAIKWIEGGCH